MIPLLLALLLAPAWEAPRLEAALYAAGMHAAIRAQGHDAPLLYALWEIESSGGVERKRSKAGACCPLQVLGGRYGHPPCDLLEASPWLCVRSAMAEIEYWRRKCPAAPLEGWSRGFRRPPERGCFPAGSYTARAKRIMRKQARQSGR